MKRRNEVMVGALTLAALAMLVLGGLWLARGGLTPGYSLYAKFPWGAGLKQGQPVQLAGVTIGFVDDVQLQMNGTLIVTLGIQRQYQVPRGSTATVDPNGIFGDQLVALTPTTPAGGMFARGDTVPVGKPKPTIGDLLVQFDSVSHDVKDITKSVEVQLVREGGANDLRRTLAAMADLATTLNRTVEQQSVELQKTMTAVRRGAQALDSASIDSTVKNLSATSKNVAQLTADLKLTTEKLNGVLGKLERGEGTAGKLLNDQGLYDDLRRLTTRLDSLTVDFKANPRKYIKFSVF
jgi:phospholipid/cholesterol/gamma-HCH transport system substrate-binding protein